jgi:hypothetical protein
MGRCHKQSSHLAHAGGCASICEFNIAKDPEELNDLATSPAHQSILQTMEQALRGILSPENT